MLQDREEGGKRKDEQVGGMRRQLAKIRNIPISQRMTG